MISFKKRKKVDRIKIINAAPLIYGEPILLDYRDPRLIHAVDDLTFSLKLCTLMADISIQHSFRRNYGCSIPICHALWTDHWKGLPTRSG
jgi:hypothetical protein